MTIIKICGLRTVEQALAAAEAGADYLGMIFASARRQVSHDNAAAISAAVHAVAARDGRAIDLVGVFVNEAPERMLGIADELALAALQLSGDENPQICRQLAERALLKAVRLNGAPEEQGWLQIPPVSPRLRLLVDAHVPGSYGGAGIVADWDRAAELARHRQIVLAGGLTAANVGSAIQRVRPWGVDVSSGVETEGVKDATKIRAFVAAVRAADRQLIGDEHAITERCTHT